MVRDRRHPSRGGWTTQFAQFIRDGIQPEPTTYADPFAGKDVPSTGLYVADDPKATGFQRPLSFAVTLFDDDGTARGALPRATIDDNVLNTTRHTLVVTDAGVRLANTPFESGVDLPDGCTQTDHATTLPGRRVRCFGWTRSTPGRPHSGEFRFGVAATRREAGRRDGRPLDLGEPVTRRAVGARVVVGRVRSRQQRLRPGRRQRGARRHRRARCHGTRVGRRRLDVVRRRTGGVRKLRHGLRHFRGAATRRVSRVADRRDPSNRAPAPTRRGRLPVDRGGRPAASAVVSRASRRTRG